MRFILLSTIILLSSCETKKETIVNRQQAIKKEMEQVKAFYYSQLDSLESVKEADTISAKHMKIAQIADRKKIVTLLRLQNEYDSLETKLEKH